MVVSGYLDFCYSCLVIENCEEQHEKAKPLIFTPGSKLPTAHAWGLTPWYIELISAHLHKHSVVWHRKLKP